MRRFPLEIEYLILRQVSDSYTRRSCALVCKSWHESCLPELFRSLTIHMDNDRHLLACSRLLTISPHLRQHVRKVWFYWDFTVRHVDEDEELMIDSILSGLTHLDELLSSPIPFETLSCVLPQLPITTLYLGEPLEAISSPLDLLSVLREAASTVRSLTLEDIMLDDPPTSIRGGPVRMTALQELAIVLCGNLPLASEFIQMPSLKTFYCAGNNTVPGDCMPSSMDTLVVAEAKVSDSFDPPSVDNFCVRWTHELWQYNTLSEAVEDAITTFTVPSKIKHLEILVSPMATPDDDTFDNMEELDERLFHLHQSGSFERLTITSEAHSLRPRWYVNRMPNLESLGLVKVRCGSSVLYPRCVDLALPWE